MHQDNAIVSLQTTTSSVGTFMWKRRHSGLQSGILPGISEQQDVHWLGRQQDAT